MAIDQVKDLRRFFKFWLGLAEHTILITRALTDRLRVPFCSRNGIRIKVDQLVGKDELVAHCFGHDLVDRKFRCRPDICHCSAERSEDRQCRECEKCFHEFHGFTFVGKTGSAVRLVAHKTALLR